MSGRFWTASKVGSSCLVFSHRLVYLDSQDRLADGCDLKRMVPIYVSKAQASCLKPKVRENTAFRDPLPSGKLWP